MRHPHPRPSVLAQLLQTAPRPPQCPPPFPPPCQWWWWWSCSCYLDADALLADQQAAQVRRHQPAQRRAPRVLPAEATPSPSLSSINQPTSPMACLPPYPWQSVVVVLRWLRASSTSRSAFSIACTDQPTHHTQPLLLLSQRRQPPPRRLVQVQCLLLTSRGPTSVTPRSLEVGVMSSYSCKTTTTTTAPSIHRSALLLHHGCCRPASLSACYPASPGAQGGGTEGPTCRWILAPVSSEMRFRVAPP